MNRSSSIPGHFSQHHHKRWLVSSLGPSTLCCAAECNTTRLFHGANAENSVGVNVAQFLHAVVCCRMQRSVKIPSAKRWSHQRFVVPIFAINCKAGYTLIVSRVSTCSCTISWTTSWDCEPITIHFSQYRRFCSPLILRETWRETFPLSFLTFRENTDCLTRMAKREMRKNIGKMVYEMTSIHLSFLSFRQHFFAFSSIWR